MTLSAALLVLLPLPQVVVVDEITNAHEVAAARTIANRGVVMVSHWLCWKSCQAANAMAQCAGMPSLTQSLSACPELQVGTAHGTSLRTLMLNHELNSLVGGMAAATLGDQTAKATTGG